MRKQANRIQARQILVLVITRGISILRGLFESIRAWSAHASRVLLTGWKPRCILRENRRLASAERTRDAVTDSSRCCLYVILVNKHYIKRDSDEALPAGQRAVHILRVCSVRSPRQRRNVSFTSYDLWGIFCFIVYANGAPMRK